jgi:hypothetical protein
MNGFPKRRLPKNILPKSLSSQHLKLKNVKIINRLYVKSDYALFKQPLMLNYHNYMPTTHINVNLE